jgi:hypothetical protein
VRAPQSNIATVCIVPQQLQPHVHEAQMCVIHISESCWDWIGVCNHMKGGTPHGSWDLHSWLG